MLRPHRAMPVGVALMLQACFCHRIPLCFNVVLRNWVCWCEVIVEQGRLNVSYKLPVKEQSA